MSTLMIELVEQFYVAIAIPSNVAADAIAPFVAIGEALRLPRRMKSHAVAN